jgi:ribosome biogenesis GTPase
MNVGRVVSGHGRHYVVESPDGQRVLCVPKGKKSQCVVGDLVRWSATQATADQGLIEGIEPRSNLLYRQDLWRTKAFAANLNQVLLMVASEPVFSESQLSRALIACEQAGIQACIVLNKADLPSATNARQRLQPYVEMGYPYFQLSLQQDPAGALQTLRALLAGRNTLVLGPSGVGKSTLINALLPQAKAEVGEISRALNSGKHTTTHTQSYTLPDWGQLAARGSLIDSPGFQEFGLRHIELQHLPSLMPDFRHRLSACRFYNCTHSQEPGCAILAAVAHGEISESRLRIYQEIREELRQTRW